MNDANFPLWGWKGFLPASVTRCSATSLLIRLAPDPSVSPRCQHCGAPCSEIHDRSPRVIRDRDLFEFRVWLEVPVRRVRCARCGVGREQLAWLALHSRITERFRSHVEVLLGLMPLKHVATITGLHWHTLKQIDKARLARILPPPDLSSVRYLVMDEFALHKGHRYATVVANAENRQVLWVGEGRSRRDIRPFFRWLGKHCDQIMAVAMDMNTAMDLEVQKH